MPQALPSEEGSPADAWNVDDLQPLLSYYLDIHNRTFTRISSLKAASMGLVSVNLAFYALVLGFDLTFMASGGPPALGPALVLLSFTLMMVLSTILATRIIFPRLEYHDLAFDDDEFDLHLKLSRSEFLENWLFHVRSALGANSKRYETNRKLFAWAVCSLLGASVVLLGYALLRSTGVLLG